MLVSGDVLTPEEAVKMLKEMKPGKEAREERMLTRGYPAYTTAAGNLLSTLAYPTCVFIDIW